MGAPPNMQFISMNGHDQNYQQQQTAAPMQPIKGKVGRKKKQAPLGQENQNPAH